jgi:hypothetical protein
MLLVDMFVFPDTEAQKHRSTEAQKQRSRGAEEQRSRGAEEQRDPASCLVAKSC